MALATDDRKRLSIALFVAWLLVNTVTAIYLPFWLAVPAGAVPYVACALIMRFLRLTSTQLLLPGAIVAIDILIRISVVTDKTSALSAIMLLTVPMLVTVSVVPLAFVLDAYVAWMLRK